MHLVIKILYLLSLSLLAMQQAFAEEATQQQSVYTIEVAPQAFIAERIPITWQGRQVPGNYITVVRPETPDSAYRHYIYTKEGRTLFLDMPMEQGMYEIRLNSESEGKVLARKPIRLVPTLVELHAPRQAATGSKVEIGFEYGLDGVVPEEDWITIVPTGADPGAYTEYVYCKQGSPVSLEMPDRAGAYEIRYVSGFHNKPLLSKPITITSAAAWVKAPPSGAIGQRIAVQWQGPEGKGDYLTIVPEGAPESEYRTYWYAVREKSPASLSLPEDPGVYEIRYVTGLSKMVLAKATIQVTDLSAKVEVPAAVTAGEPFSVKWQGPDGEGNFIAILRDDAGTWWSWSYTKWGNPAVLQAPKLPGRYRVCYQLGNHRILAETTLQVKTGDKPGSLLIQPPNDGTDVLKDVAVEVILDASGSMLKRVGDETRMTVARSALSQIVESGLRKETRFALRVFGHREAGSCRSDLELPLAALDRASASQRISTIQAKNLAKTPIADSLDQVALDLAGHKGRAIVILLTDGEETCGGDPELSIRRLVESGIGVRTNVVGFSIGDLGLKQRFEAWAQAGSGVYLDADKPEELKHRLFQSLRPPYRVVDEKGMVVSQGTMDENPIALKPGRYRLQWGSAWLESREFAIDSGQVTQVAL